MPRINLDENGVTIKCEDGLPGYKEVANRMEYEVVDLETLKNHILINSNLTRPCTALITDRSGLFKNQGVNQANRIPENGCSISVIEHIFNGLKYTEVIQQNEETVQSPAPVSHKI